jgi:hypothetical protein
VDQLNKINDSWKELLQNEQFKQLLPESADAQESEVSEVSKSDDVYKCFKYLKPLWTTFSITL